jgi:serine/threonine protein phosphatase PrpC
VALTIVEQAEASDVGRQRESNEDAVFVRPPLFAVADGMGGARAGEVASQMATQALEEREESSDPPEQQLTLLAQKANREIYDLAERDESRRGMGTTLTAAMVTETEVAIGHVGDSRAYRLRDGALEQLTRDHSLVAELERTGQISPEAAEHHPQKSIITRALGPEPDVEVDTYSVPAREGDVFLLCSDGLTGMVSDDELAAILRSSPSLDDAATSLVRAANQGGGKDNISVVLFRLGDDADDGQEAAAEPGAGETIAGQVSADDVRAARTTAPAAVAAEPTTARATGRRTPRPRPVRPTRERRGFGRALLRGVLALILVGAVGVGLWALSRQVWFVGTDDAGLVTLYRGVPYELPFGVSLYSQQYESGVPARAIPAARRKRILGHEWRSRDDAVDLVRQLERGGLEVSR